MAEDINQDEDDIEEEEEDRGAEAQQTLDDLTVLGDSSDRLDDPEEQGPGDDLSEWEEPSASQSLSVIHTGSRPTDAELLSNLIPEGEVIVEEGEIIRTDEEVGDPLDDIEPPAVELDSPERDDPPAERDPEPTPPPQAQADEPAPPPAPDDEPVVEERDVDVQPAEAAAAAAAPPPDVLPVEPPDEEEEEEEDDDDDDVDVDPLETTDAVGSEDSAIALDIDPGDATEVTIANVPEGAVLSAGTDNGDGTWTLTADQLDELTITPSADSDVDFTLEVTAGDDTESLDVTVNAVADAPTATAEDAAGQEDTAIDLDLGTALSDIDGSESLSVTISGMPSGASLSAGTDNGDGTWTLDAGDLAGLQITPPADFAGEIPLTLTSTSTEADGGDSATTEVPFTVTVADTVDVTAATTLEDTAVALNIELPDGVTTFDVSGVPDGATLSVGTDNGDGSWTISADDLANLTITPPADSDVDFTLQVEAGGVTQDLDVTVIADVDKPTADGQDESGVAGSEIPLNLTAGLSDTDGSETLSITLGGVPDDATLNAGTKNDDGTWTLEVSDFDGLTITPASGFSGEFDLTLTSTATEQENNDSWTVTDTFTVTVTESGEFGVTQAEGIEDTAISLNIDAGGAQEVVIGNVPDGAALSAGTDNGDGSWTVSSLDLAGLTVTPPADSDADFTLSVTADGQSADLNVIVDADADAPTVTITPDADPDQATYSGDLNTAVTLDLGAALTDTDGSESLSVTISGVPSGASLSAGTDNGDGTWTLTQGDLSNLEFTPAEGDFGTIDLTLSATSTEADGGDSETTTQDFSIYIDPGDAFGANEAEGNEDSAIELDISAGLESSVTISDVPDGAVLSAGTDNGDGTWTIASGDLDGLTITPPTDSDEDFALTVTAGAETTTFDVTVNAVADAPDVQTADASGVEDTAINLNVGAVVTDSDGSETLSDTYTLSGMPDGATLNNGTDNGDGTWTLSADDLNGLQITPPPGFPEAGVEQDSFDLTLFSTSVESDPDAAVSTAIGQETFTVTVTGDGNDAVFDVTAAEGLEDNAIPLDIDPGSATSFDISNVPDGAVLSAGTDNGDGTWTLSADDLDGLTITPPPDSDDDFTLQISDGDETIPLDVNVLAVADRPDFDVEDVVVDEDSIIPINITAPEGMSSMLSDVDGSETLSLDIQIDGIPPGVVLATGSGEENQIALTYDPDTDSYSASLDPGQLDNLFLIPPQDFYGDINLQVEATATETGEDIAVEHATNIQSFGVTVKPVEDNPVVTAQAATGDEDTAIALDLSATMEAGVTEEVAEIIIGNVADGSTFSAGTDNGDGTWTLSVEDLDGLTITPPQDFNGTQFMTMTAISTDGGVNVAGFTLNVEDTPDLMVEDSVGTEDTAISLNIDAGTAESATITDIPEGAVLTSNGENIDITDGSATLTSAQLENLTITPPADSDTDFTLTVSSEAQTMELDVSVAADADAPTLTLGATAEGTEDTAISLSIASDVTDVDNSETLSVSISGIPDGAVLTSGGQTITVDENGVADVDPALLAGLQITPPADSDGDFQLTVSATSTEGAGGDTETTSGTIDVSVAADADAPTLTLDTTAGGTEDTAINLDIASGLTDTDGSETLSVTIGDIPAGSTLTSGGQTITVDENGNADVSPDQLAGLQITPPDDFSGTFDLSVTSTATEGDGGDTATTSGTITVDVAADADDPTLTLDTTAAGGEDTAIALDINAGVTDASETLSVTISGVPTGASLNAGIDNGDGTWTLESGDLPGLTVTPPADSDGDFQLSVTATSMDGDDTATTTGTIDVSVAADADTPTLTLGETASGAEDGAIDLDIASGLTDTDGSETLSVTIGDIPAGSTLTSGGQTITVDENGNADVSPDQLAGLQITPPEDFSGSFDLTVTSTATEGDGGDTATSTGSITVDVAAVADDPTLTVDTTATGAEDTAIALDIDAGVTDGSETLAVSIGGIPDGAVLTSNGQPIAVDENGVANVDPSQLAGLQILPPADSNVDFDLTVTATSTDGEDTATTTSTISVDVTGDADAATLSAEAGDSTTDGTTTTIDLDVASGLTDTDGSESLSISIGGIPDGAVLTSGGQTITVDENGVADVDPSQLAGLQITVPNDIGTSFDLSVNATSTEDDGDTQTVSSTISIADPDQTAEGVDLDVNSVAAGMEDTAIGLNIDADLIDTDGSESLSISIGGIPDGAVLTSGGQTITVDENGNADVSADQLDGLQITPPADSNENFQLSVTATSTEASTGDTSTVTENLDVVVFGDADAPTLDLTDATGVDDTAIPLTINTGLTDTDGSETLSVTVSNIPDGAVLSSGGEVIQTDGGSVTLTAEQLTDLAIVPPEGNDGDFSLLVSATATEDDGDSNTVSGILEVTVENDGADTPTLDLTDATGTEDQAIALDIDAGLTDTDGSETLSVTISNVPDGAELSAGTDNGNGSWTLDSGDLDGLTVTPPQDFSGSFDLTVTATTTEDDGDTSTTSGTLTVDVAEVDDSAEGSTLNVSDAAGTEDTAIDLDIGVTQLDTDGSETISVTVSGVPDGASLNAGTDNGDGTWTLDSGDLDGLQLTPPADSNEDFSLGVSVTTTEANGGESTTTSGTIDVDLTGDSDGASLSVSLGDDDVDVTGVTYDLDVSAALSDTDGSETLSITISDVPAGVTLDAGTNNGDGTWSLDADDLDGLSMTVADGTPAFDLTISSTATEDDGDTSTTTATISVDATDTSADEADLSASDAVGSEDTAIALDIDAGLADTDGSESLSITISGVPDGAALSAGTENQDGTWTLEAGDLDGLTVTPAADSNEDFSLTVSATTTEASSGDTTTTTTTLDVDVTGVADAPTLSVSIGDGEITTANAEIVDVSIGVDNVTDTEAGFTVEARNIDGDGNLTDASADNISFNNSPPGFGVSGGASGADSELGYDSATDTSEELIVSFDEDVSSVDVSFAWLAGSEDASYEIYQDGQKVGEGTIDGGSDGVDGPFTLSADNDVAFDQIVFTSPGDGHDFLINSLDFQASEGGETAVTYPLDITSNLADTDGSESLSITVADLPDGASLSAGTANDDGSWTLSSDDLDGLEITLTGEDPGQSFDLTVTATATEDDGDTASVSSTASADGVVLDDSADGATVETSDASGNEDTAIALDIEVTQIDTDGSETMSITISDVPTGASLSAGTDNGNGTWTLDAGDLDGLSITPADDSNADFTLGISVTTTETSSGDTSTTTSTLDVDVAGVADAPTVSASTTYDSELSSETSISVPQTITDAADTDGSTVTVSGVPNGASLSAGTDNGDGTWTLDGDDLDSLTVTPADGSTDDMSLSFDVSGAGGAGDTVGSEDFSSGVSGWSGGMSASNGEMKIGGDNKDETASKTFDFGDEHAGQTVTVSFDVEMFGGWDESGGSRDYFQVSANDTQVINTTDDDQNSYSFEVTLDENGQVDLTFGADTTYAPEGVNIDNLTFTAGDDWESSLASETVDVTPEPAGFIYDLDITAGLGDTDGSETVSVTVGNMPNGAELSAGTDNGDGTWTLGAGDLDGLQVTVPTDAGDFDLSVSATATEDDGDTNSVATSVSISTPDLVAEDASLSTTDASGEEDRAIALDIDAGLTDTDGSETLSISISGVPDGAELSAGTDNGDGSWTLDAGDLDGLTILPPTDSSADMSLTVTATTTETSTGDTSEVTSTMSVSVDGVADAPELSVSLGDGVEVGGGATPVSFWMMEENTGGASEGYTITDAMGNNNGAVGAAGQDLNDAGVSGLATEFEKDYGDHIEVPHDDSLKPESGALTMWFNADKVSGAGRFTLASSDSSGNDDGGHFGLFIEGGELRLRMQDDGNDETDITGGDVDKNEWNQVTVTWGEDGANVYLNGELVASDPDWTEGLEGNENPWTFGANQWNSGDNTANNLQDYFDGHMDDIAIYDEQLSADDVQALFDDGVQDVMDSDEGGDSMQFPVDITAALADTDGSESMSISIEGIPDGAALSAGTDNGDGTWSVDEGDLDGLTLTVPADADDFAMSVSATVTDEGGDTRTVIETVEVDVSGDGFDAGITGTGAGDTLTGSAGDDLISGQDGNDDISGGDGADTLLGGEGDDQIDGGDGNDVIDGGAGDDTIEGGAGDDNIMGGQGDDLFIFGAGDGADYFQGGDGWSDTVHLDDVSGGPGGDSGWTLQVDEGAGYTQDEDGITFDAEASGVITLDDGSELTFDGVEKLEW